VRNKKLFAAIAGFILVALLAVTTCPASEGDHPDKEEKAARSDLAVGLIALGAALTVGLAAIATGIAQSRIGSAGCGTLAEKPELSGTIIILVAIPETMVILGFVVAIVALFVL
jgi:V/A-type H+-transporting ATPase subunit K